MVPRSSRSNRTTSTPTGWGSGWVLNKRAISSKTATPEAPSLAPRTGSMRRSGSGSLSATGRLSQWAASRTRRVASGRQLAITLVPANVRLVSRGSGIWICCSTTRSAQRPSRSTSQTRVESWGRRAGDAGAEGGLLRDERVGARLVELGQVRRAVSPAERERHHEDDRQGADSDPERGAAPDRSRRGGSRAAHAGRAKNWRSSKSSASWPLASASGRSAAKRRAWTRARSKRSASAASSGGVCSAGDAASAPASE